MKIFYLSLFYLLSFVNGAWINPDVFPCRGSDPLCWYYINGSGQRVSATVVDLRGQTRNGPPDDTVDPGAGIPNLYHCIGACTFNIDHDQTNQWADGTAVSTVWIAPESFDATGWWIYLETANRSPMCAESGFTYDGSGLNKGFWVFDWARGGPQGNTDYYYIVNDILNEYGLYKTFNMPAAGGAYRVLKSVDFLYKIGDNTWRNMVALISMGDDNIVYVIYNYDFTATRQDLYQQPSGIWGPGIEVQAVGTRPHGTLGVVQVKNFDLANGDWTQVDIGTLDTADGSPCWTNYYGASDTGFVCGS